MPNLTEFNAGNLGLQPSEVGESALVSSARRIGAFAHETAEDINQVGQRFGGAIKDAGDVYVKYREHQDVAKAAADFTQLQDNLIQQWNATAKNADPNDPTVATKFREDVLEPALENFGSNLGTEKGQDFAQAHVASLRQHMFEKTASDMSSLAGVAAKVNFEKTVNSLSNTVMNDPSSLDHALQIADSSVAGIAGTSPNLNATDAARVRSEGSLHAKEQIVKAAAYGAIQNTGKMPDWLSDPKYSQYVNGMELKQFEQAAKVQAKSNALMDRQAQVLAKQQAELKVHTDANKVITDNISTDPQTGRILIKPQFFSDTLDIVKHNPDAPNAASVFDTFTKFGQSQQNQEVKPVDDPVVKSDLMTRMFSADNPTSTLDLMKARAQGKISDQSFQAMHGLVQELEQTPLKGPIWQSVTTAAKSQLIRTDLMGDKIGADLYAGFMQDFIPQYLAKSRSNTLPPNALDLNDPKSMISQAIQPYRLSMQDKMKLGNAAPAPTRNDVMPAIPPPAQRPAGSIYDTPKGKLKWTGTGWVQP